MIDYNKKIWWSEQENIKDNIIDLATNQYWPIKNVRCEPKHISNLKTVPMIQNQKHQSKWQTWILKCLILCSSKNCVLSSSLLLHSKHKRLVSVANTEGSLKYRTYNFRGFGPEDLSSRRMPRRWVFSQSLQQCS